MPPPLFKWTVGRRGKEEGLQGEIMRAGDWRGLKGGPEKRDWERREMSVEI